MGPTPHRQRRAAGSKTPQLPECAEDGDPGKGPVHPFNVLLCSPHMELADEVTVQELGTIHKVDPVGMSVVAIPNRTTYC